MKQDVIFDIFPIHRFWQLPIAKQLTDRKVFKLSLTSKWVKLEMVLSDWTIMTGLQLRYYEKNIRKLQ